MIVTESPLLTFKLTYNIIVPTNNVTPQNAHTNYTFNVLFQVLSNEL